MFHIIPHDFNEGLNELERGFGGQGGPVRSPARLSSTR